MKLLIKRIAACVPGCYAYALCDEKGEMLPMQTRCIVDTGINGSTVTVEFSVDGDELRLGE